MPVKNTLLKKFPFTAEENLSLLRNAGFSWAEIYFRWINFASFVAMKEEGQGGLLCLPQ